MRTRWAVLISGRGSNLGALLDLREEIDIALVVSSSAKAYGLLRAKRAGVPTTLTPLIDGTKKIDWSTLDSLLRQQKIDRVFLAGFMKVVPPQFVEAWRGKILNLHPSLLPAYPGLRSIERAHEEAAHLGLTVHEVNEEVDQGRHLCQRRCLKGEELRGYSLAFSEFLVHVDEQRVIKEVVRRLATQVAARTFFAEPDDLFRSSNQVDGRKAWK